MFKPHILLQTFSGIIEFLLRRSSRGLAPQEKALSQVATILHTVEGWTEILLSGQAGSSIQEKAVLKVSWSRIEGLSPSDNS